MRSLSRSILLPCALVLLAGAGSPDAAAAQRAREPDPQQLHIARALFEEGLRFVDAQQWDEAADRFSRVLQIKWSPVVAYNLGSARLRQGQAVLAAEQFRRVLREPDLDASVRKAASELLAQAEAKMGSVRIAVEGPDEGTGTLVDGNPWPKAAMGVSVPFDPGPHRIQLLRGEDLLDDREVEVKAGEVLEVVFDLRPSEPVPSPEAVAVAAAPDQEATSPAPVSGPTDYDRAEIDDGGGSRWWLWTSIGVAVVAATVAGVLVATADPGDPDPVPGDVGVVEGKVR